MEEQDSRHTEALQKFLKQGSLHVYGDGSLSQAEFEDYGKDRSRLERGPYKFLIFPKNTEEAAAILQYCSQHRLSVVPSGGRTGLCGGATAGSGEIVISLKKMKRLLRFDPYLPALHVEAGMLTAEVQEEAQKRGFFFPLDLAASGSSQIGGNLASNAGGTRVIRYGGLRNWLLGLTVVGARGEVLRFPGPLMKNNTGFDLKQLFIGQEGTLGIITEALLRLAPQPRALQCSIAGLESLGTALALLKRLRFLGKSLMAFEYWDETAMESVCKYLEIKNPFAKKYKAYCLLEWEGGDAGEEQELAYLEEIQKQEGLKEIFLAQSRKQKEEFWKYREGISESLVIHKLLHKQDLSLPILYLAQFHRWVELLLKKEFVELESIFFGHVGDGNLHLNIRSKQEMEMGHFQKLCKKLDQKIYQMIHRLGGSISAEHGIGLLKRDFLSYAHGSKELALMRSVKKLLDPQGILNPGKIFP